MSSSSFGSTHHVSVNYAFVKLPVKQVEVYQLCSIQKPENTGYFTAD